MWPILALFGLLAVGISGSGVMKSVPVSDILSPGAAAPSVVQVQAGQTWQIKILFSGVTPEEAQAFQRMYAGGMAGVADVLSWLVDAHSNTVTVTDRYKAPAQIFVNQSMAVGGKSARIVSATQVG